MARKIGRYQEKLRLGLVPFRYNPNPESYQRGAHRWWPSRQRGETSAEYNKRLSKLAWAETPSNNGYFGPGHRFV